MVPSVLAQFCPDPGFSIVYFSPLGPPKPAPEPSPDARLTLEVSYLRLVGDARSLQDACDEM